MAVEADAYYMREALRLAARGWGHASPNPMVGAVVVQGETIIGKGYHAAAGGPHAEVNALREAGSKARGATLYVTLEPCNHQGRTPPCTLAILEAGIARVVVGMRDPNPRVAGGGSETLRHKGLAVETGVLEKQCRLLNQAFIKHVTTGLPYVTLKAAMTLDGRIATRTGDSRWISNERSRRFVHALRCRTDAVVVGIGTALADDPQLTARLSKTRKCRQPVRVVLDSTLKLPLDSQLVRTAREVPVWIACCAAASAVKASSLSQAGAIILRLADSSATVDLLSLLQELGRRDLNSLLVEGGARVIGAFLERRLADELHFFYAPKILGDPQAVPAVMGEPRERISDALPAHEIRVRRFDQDIMISGKLHPDLY